MRDLLSTCDQSPLFFGGVPTGPEVNALVSSVAVEVGESISYEEVERIITVSATTSRFRTITSAWRKRLFREKGIFTKAEGGAFHFLTADAVQDEAGARVARIGRATGRLVRDVGAIRSDDLSSDERRARQRLMMRETAAMLEASRASARHLAEPQAKVGTTLRIAKS